MKERNNIKRLKNVVNKEKKLLMIFNLTNIKTKT